MHDVFIAIYSLMSQVVISLWFWIVVAVSVFFFIGLAWYRHLKIRALSELQYSRSFSAKGVFATDSFTMTEVLKNPTLFPLFSVRMEFVFPEGFTIDDLDCGEQTKVASMFFIPPKASVTKTHTVRADMRGYYHMETATVKYRKNEFLFSVPFDIYVYPNYSLINADIEPDLYHIGNSISKRRYIEDPFFLAGIRPYQIGDSEHSINFKASAHSFYGGARCLMSNYYDSSRNYDSMIFLDLFNYSGNGTAEIQKQQLEMGLSYACYLLSEIASNGGNIGFASNSASGNGAYVHIPCRSGNLHVQRLLECFAKINYYDKREYSINSLLDNFTKELVEGTDVYLITPVVDSKTAATLRQIEFAGHNVCVLSLANTDRRYNDEADT